MAYGLGSARTNRWTMALYATIAVAWSGWRLWRYHSSEYVLVELEPQSDTPPIELFGGLLQPGNSIELSVPKAELGRMLGFIDVMRFGAIIVGMIVIVAGMLFVYRFCDRVIANKTFTDAARNDIVLIGVCIVAYPAITGFMNLLGTNSVVGAMDLGEIVDTSRTATGLYAALVIAVFLQFVYATIAQGSKLAHDADGLV